MNVYLNGDFLPETEAHVSVFDRGFLYGDGLFETIRIANSFPFRFGRHLVRLERGAEYLGIKLPGAGEMLLEAALRLINENGCSEGVIRITVSRGVGRRGYSPRGAEKPTILISTHPLPPLHPEPGPGLAVFTASARVLAGDPLARVKSANKLAQVLARAEAEARGGDEALLLNHREEVAESSSGNVFLFRGNRLLTPPLEAGALPGIARETVLKLASALALPAAEQTLRLQDFTAAEEVFLTHTSQGVVPVASLDEVPVKSCGVAARLRRAYVERVNTETSGRIHGLGA